MRLITAALTVSFLLVAAASGAEEWEIAGEAGYGWYRNVTATSNAGTAKVGFGSGALFSVVGTHNMYRRIGGEARYIYSFSDLKLSGGQSARLNGESHTFDYNFLFYATRGEAAVRPFFAAGAGAKLFRGTGKEPVFQPVSNVAVLTHTQEIKPEVSFGAGVKFRAGRNAIFRLDFRDYVSPFPQHVIAPRPPTGSVSGWLHDFVVMAGVGIAF